MRISVQMWQLVMFLIFQISDKRIVDINKNKKQYESLRCFVCSNLARNPKQCSNTKCQRIMCERCRKESINECPNCKQSNPQFVDILRLLKDLLDGTQILCINCNKPTPYEQLDKHELECSKASCTLCKQKFGPFITFQEHYTDVCPKYVIKCEICCQRLKRKEFINHPKCDKNLAQAHEDAYNKVPLPPKPQKVPEKKPEK